jgi:hypothetical protein
VFPTETLYTPLHSPIHATCPAHLILLNFITRTILGEEYRSLRTLDHTNIFKPNINKLSIRWNAWVSVNKLQTWTVPFRFSFKLKLVTQQLVCGAHLHPYKYCGQMARAVWR